MLVDNLTSMKTLKMISKLFLSYNIFKAKPLLPQILQLVGS